MRFLVDAQLPRRVAYWLNDGGHDSIHTLDLPLKNKTPDSTINQLSSGEQRIVMTKDADFVDICSAWKTLETFADFNRKYSQLGTGGFALRKYRKAHRNF